MRVLVTGGAGYVGSQTVRALLARGDGVVVLDDLSTGHPGSIGRATLVEGSVTDTTVVDSVLRAHRPDAVIHFAALKAADESLEHPDRYMTTNVAGTVNVLGALARHRIDRLVFSSTCAVYGTPRSLPVRETAPLRPENPYGESKVLVERMLPWYARAFGLRYAALRYFNAAGADPSGEHGERWDAARNLVPRVLRAAREGRPVEVYGTDYPTPDGTAVRDYVHVVDLAEAHLAALDRLDRAAGSFVLNLGTGSGASVLEVVSAARAVTGREIDTIARARRPGDPAAVWADASRAARILGWRTRHDLHAMLADAWRWHDRHPDGYAPATSDGAPARTTAEADGAAEPPPAGRTPAASR